jgi:hypothetical protein
LIAIRVNGPACASEPTVKPDEPRLITPRLDPCLPVLSLGRADPPPGAAAGTPPPVVAVLAVANA